MTDERSANDILMGAGGYPTAKLDRLRVWVGGRIVAKPTARQETEFGTGTPRTYPRSGDPIMGILVDVQTDERLDAEDNGVRRMYIEGRRLKEAVREGVLASGAEGLDPGGQLFVAWIGEEQGQGATPAKVYEARYYPPTTPVPSATNGQAAAEPMPDPRAGGGLNEFAPLPQDAPPPAFVPDRPEDLSPAPMSDPRVSSPAPAPASPQNGAQGPTAEAIAALRAAGLDPATVFPNYQG